MPASVLQIIADGGSRSSDFLNYLSPFFIVVFTMANYIELFFEYLKPVFIPAGVLIFLLISIWALIRSKGREKGAIYLYFSICAGIGGFGLLINRYPTAGLILLLVAAVSAGISSRLSSPLKQESNSRNNLSFRLYLFLILFFSLLVYLYRLDSIPPSTNGYEVSSGISALQLIHKVKPGISEMLWKYLDRTYAGSPTSPFFIYFTAGLFQVFGGGLLTLRIGGVFWGLISLLMFYFLIKALFNRRLALLTILIAATLPWFMSVARLGTYSSLSMAYFLAVIYLFTRGLQGKFLHFLLAGALFSLITYFYLPVKILIPLLILLWFHSLIIDKSSLLKNILGILFFLGAYSVLSILLGNPIFSRLVGVVSRNAFIGNLPQQSGFNPVGALNDLYEKAGNIFYNLFFRSHEFVYPYSHGPLVNRGVLLLAGLGLGWSVSRWKGRGYFLLLTGVTATFLPVLLCNPLPNNQATVRRCFLAAPFLACLAAIILEVFLNKTASIWKKYGSVLGRIAVGFFLISSTLLNLNHYFNAPPYPFGETLWEFRKIARELLQRGYRLEVVHGHPYFEHYLREVVDFEAWLQTGQIYSFYTWDGPRRNPEIPQVESIIKNPICRHWPSDCLGKALQSTTTEKRAFLILLEYPYEGLSSPTRIRSFDPQARVTKIKSRAGRTIGFLYLPKLQ